MIRRTVLGVVVCLVAARAYGYSEGEIDAAGDVARQVEIVNLIASDAFGGRNNDTPESAAVQALLLGELKQIGPGLDASQAGDDAYRQPFASLVDGTNLLAVIPGSTAPDEYIMIGAHYDHVGSIGADIYNGATDNAAGAAIVLAVGAAIDSLPQPPKRSVILALWDAEEDGLIGSEHFSNAPLVPLSSIKGYVNLDILGANLLPSLRAVSTMVAAESGGAILEDMVTNATQDSWLGVTPLSRIFGQDRSDHASFIDDGVPVVFMSDGTGSCYHTPDDDPSVVDMAKLAEQGEVAFRLVLELAEAPAVPNHTPTGLFDTVYRDAVEMLALIETSLADLSLFSPAVQTQILAHRANVLAVVDAGPGSFTFNDGLIVAQAADALTTVIKGLPCDGFHAMSVEVPATSAPLRFAAAFLIVAIGACFARATGARARGPVARGES